MGQSENSFCPYIKIMLLYFDTETTGLRPGQICQLSYIMQSGEKIVAKNFFFSVDYVEPSAYMVHGFSVQKLKELSGGKKFIDHFEEIKNDFEAADMIVAHNTAFDFSFMRAEYERLNETFFINNEFCSMKKATPICALTRKSGNGYKYPKLKELCDFVGIYEEDIEKSISCLYGQHLGFHDARFDASALYLAINECFKKEIFKELIEYL